MNLQSSTVKVQDLKLNEQIDQNYFIFDNFILFTKGSQIEKIDIDLLKKWNIDKVEAKNYLQSEKKFKIYFKEQLKEFKNFTNKFLMDLKVFYENIRLSYKINLPEFDHYFEHLYDFYSNPSNYFSFYLNTALTSKSYEYVALATAFYCIMLGSKMGLSKSDLRKLFYAAILADIGFQRKSEKSILAATKDGEKENFDLNNIDYLKFHVKLSCDILKKELKASNDLTYLVLTQHSYLDGTGLFSLPPEKITLLSRIFVICHEYVYLTSNFLDEFRAPALPSNGILHMLTYKKRYDKKIFKSFLASNSFFPPGEVILLNNKKIAVSVKATYRYPKRPLVEIIMKDKKIGISPTETINLASENLEVVALLDKPALRKKFINNIYKSL